MHVGRRGRSGVAVPHRPRETEEGGVPAGPMGAQTPTASINEKPHWRKPESFAVAGDSVGVARRSAATVALDRVLDLFARSEDEHLDAEVGVDMVAAHEPDYSAAGQALHVSVELLVHRPL
jgi:hypothetical protein